MTDYEELRRALPDDPEPDDCRSPEWAAWVRRDIENGHVFHSTITRSQVRALLDERDALIHDNAELVKAASAEATEVTQLRDLLSRARTEFAAFPQSLGYDFGIIRDIDAALEQKS